jgi:hypothetical protein
VFRHPVVFECEDDPDHNGDELDDQTLSDVVEDHWPSLLFFLDDWKKDATVPDAHIQAPTAQFCSSSKKGVFHHKCDRWMRNEPIVTTTAVDCCK